VQVKIEKFLFAGTKNSIDRFFDKAQKMGFIQFISVTGKKPHLFPKEVQRAKDAIKILSTHAKGKQDDEAPVPIAQVINEVITTSEKLEVAREQKRLLRMELKRLAPLGSFSIDQIHAIEEEGHKSIQFFMMRHDRIPASEVPKELIFLTRENNIDYFMYVGDEKFDHEAITEMEVERSRDAVQEELTTLQEDIKEWEALELDNCKYIKLMEEYIFRRMNSINLNFAKDDVDLFVEDKLFMIEAWVRKDQTEKVRQLTDDLAIISEKVAIEKDDRPPTHLKNKRFAKMGEDLVYVYDTPDIQDKDPSSWVLWFFALFFGMIISDAGYGMLFLAGAIFGWIKYGKTVKGMGRRMLKTLTLISCSTIIWGVMVASYFSIKFEPNDFLNRISLPYNLALKKVEYHHNHDTPLYKEWVKDYPNIADVDRPEVIIEKATKKKGNHIVYDLMDTTYDGIFLELSLLVGIFHLCTSFARNLYRSWSGFGWILALLGGYLYFPKILNAYSMAVYTGLMTRDYSIQLGEYMLYGGLISAVVLAIIQERSIAGIGVIVKAIEVFADTLSYLRLYALGLASMVLAGTFNEIGPAIGGPVFGPIIILLGHIVNISLGVMAGVIHGLRLNFLEWYHHCYEGGGKKFSPLRLLKRE